MADPTLHGQVPDDRTPGARALEDTPAGFDADIDPDAPIGAADLKRRYNRYLTMGLGLAIVLHVAGIGAYWGITRMAQAETGPEEELEIVNYADLAPPPIDAPPDAPPPPATAAAPVVSGEITPVPDEEAPPEQRVATQDELATSSIGPPGTGNIGVVGGTGPVQAAAPPPPPPPPPPPDAPTWPRIDETFTIVPRVSSSRGSAYFVHRNTPVRFTAITCAHASTG